jgi:hypothetical protein
MFVFVLVFFEDVNADRENEAGRSFLVGYLCAGIGMCGEC